MEQQLIYLPKEFRREVKSKAFLLGKKISEFTQEALVFYISHLELDKDIA